MKPANELQIKRNIYTFSALVLLLSVAIGSGAWTLNHAKIGDAHLDTEALYADTMRLWTQCKHLDSLRGGFNREVDSLKAQLDGARNTDLPRQIKLINKFMDDAVAKDGDDLVNFVDLKSPKLGDSASAIADDLLSSSKYVFKTFGTKTKQLSADLREAKKLGGGGSPPTGSKLAGGAVDMVALQVERDALKGEIESCKAARTKAEQKPAVIRVAMQAGLDRLREGTLLSTSVISKATPEALNPDTKSQWQDVAKCQRAIREYKALCISIAQ